MVSSHVFGVWVLMGLIVIGWISPFQIAMGVPLHRLKDIRLLYGESPWGVTPISFDTPANPPLARGHVIAARITSENPDEASGRGPHASHLQSPGVGQTLNVSLGCDAQASWCTKKDTVLWEGTQFIDGKHVSGTGQIPSCISLLTYVTVPLLGSILLYYSFEVRVLLCAWDLLGPD